MFKNKKEFWKKLDYIVRKPQTPESTKKFVDCLAEGYEKNLPILICGVDNFVDTVKQASYVNDGKRTMLYFTDERWYFPNLYFAIGATCIEVNMRDIIDSSMRQDNIVELLFNPGAENMYFIPKDMLTFAKPSE